MSSYEFFLKKTNHFLFIVFIIITIKTINTQTNKHSKVLTLPNNNSYIVYSNGILFYNYNDNSCTIIMAFNEDQILNSDEEFDMVFFGSYFELPSLYVIVVKQYSYAVDIDGGYYCYSTLDDIIGNKIFLAITFKCYSSYCYYILGTKDSSNKLNLYLIQNAKQQCICQVAYKVEIDGNSDNFNCHLLDDTSDNFKITCFYQNNISKEIISSNFVINLSSEIIEKVSTTSIENNGGKIIKSYLSNDRSTALVCCLNEENNSYECLTYNIINNIWINNNIYTLDNCLPQFSSLNLDKINNNSNEYFLYCFQSSTEFNILKLNSNFEVVNTEENGVYYLNETIINNCNQYSLISLVKNNDNNNIDYMIFCDTKIMKYGIEKVINIKTSIIQKTTLPLMHTSLITSQITKTSSIISPTTQTSLIIPQSIKASSITSVPIKTSLIMNKQIISSLIIPKTIKSSSITSTSTKTTLIISSLLTYPSTKTTFLSTKTTTPFIKTTTPSTKTTLIIPQPNNSSLIILQSIKSSLVVSSIKKINNDDEFPIIQKVSYQKKEEIINDLDNFMKEYKDGNIYEIFGNDYKIKISPINANKYSNISSYIDFLNCENLLREKNGLSSSSNLTVYQLEIDNKYGQSLVNEIEYAVYSNEKNERLDLSICSEETIQINYQIKNTSLLDLDKINYYSEIGIDIFNSADDFFNDICIPYSENNSDIILKDRIEDIYENYTVCESNCKYNGINISESIITCECTVKTNIDTNVNVKKLELNEIIIDTFTGSNIGIMKCYKLVFNMTGKHKNIGFILFTILIFLHVPIYIQYFRYNILYIQKFIYTELNKYDYWNCLFNPIKKEKTKKEGKIKKNSIKIKGRNDDKIIINKNKSGSQKFIEKSSNLDIYKNYNSNNLYESKESLKIKNINDERQNNINKKKGSKDVKNPVVLLKYNVINKNYINLENSKKRKSSVNYFINKDKKKKSKKKKLKFSPNQYYLIQINANNTSRKEPPNSNIILDNYQYETAIKYDKRDFFRIFFICLLYKENILKLIMFKIPIVMRGLNLCHFIFIYSSDLAFNTIFYSNEKISEKYHYQGYNLFYFSLVNNIIKNLLSAILSIGVVNLFQFLIDSRIYFENIFRKEEKKMRKDKNYKINKETKCKILNEIREISSKLKNKIIIFLISEFSLMLFFYYFVTAFCEVYKKTQVSWIIDFLTSYLLSILTEIFLTWILTLFYIVSIRYKIKFVYTIVLFIYNF